MPIIHKQHGKPKPITFVDLGSGLAKGRAYRLATKRHAKGKQGTFKAVDIRKAEYEPLPNLELVQKDAVAYLRSLQPKSVKVINADFLVLEFQKKGMLPELLRQVKRTLADNGRLHLTITQSQLGQVKTELERAGFTVTHRPVKIMESKSPQTAFTYWIRYKYGFKFGRLLKPIKIFARKKLKNNYA